MVLTGDDGEATGIGFPPRGLDDVHRDGIQNVRDNLNALHNVIARLGQAAVASKICHSSKHGVRVIAICEKPLYGFVIQLLILGSAKRDFEIIQVASAFRRTLRVIVTALAAPSIQDGIQIDRS